jgi:hypothetical protein
MLLLSVSCLVIDSCSSGRRPSIHSPRMETRNASSRSTRVPWKRYSLVWRLSSAGYPTWSDGEVDPNKPVQYKVSRMPYPQTTNITQIAADIYRPIKPFRLMSACVIGSHLRETCIADTVICEAASFDENDSCELPDWTPPKRPRKVKVIDNLYKVSFKPNGKFLPQAEADAFDFPGRIGDHPEIELDPTTLDNDTADGSRSRDIAKGLFALLPPRTMKLGRFDKLPQIRVIQGHGVTYMPLLSEVCCIYYETRSAILDELLLACTAFPHQGLHKHIRLETALAIPNRQRLQMGCCAIASKVCRS